MNLHFELPPEIVNHLDNFGIETSYIRQLQKQTTQRGVNESSASEYYKAQSRHLTSACTELVHAHTGNLILSSHRAHYHLPVMLQLLILVNFQNEFTGNFEKPCSHMIS